jgi:hypothetical protein
MTPRFFIIDHSEHPWGDYGDMLTQGMACRGDSGVLEIERTGPFIPPMTFPGLGEVVVTDELRLRLERSALKGFVFEPVVKRLIVQSDWNTWDQLAEDPAEHPKSGEPEDYVLGQPHSVDAAAQMGNLWAIRLNREAQTQREQRIVQSRREIKLVNTTWRGQDIFGAQGVAFVYITEAAKLWLEGHLPGQLAFEEAATVAA